MNVYDKQAQDLMDKIGLKITVKFLRFDRYFEDEEERDIYEVTFKRGNQEYTFTFGQSIVNSGTWEVPGKMGFPLKIARDVKEDLWRSGPWQRKKPKEPKPYDILACLESRNPGTFGEFCSEFGYDTDSRSAHKIYTAVVEQYLQLSRMFSSEELEALGEIC